MIALSSCSTIAWASSRGVPLQDAAHGTVGPDRTAFLGSSAACGDSRAYWASSIPFFVAILSLKTDSTAWVDIVPLIPPFGTQNTSPVFLGDISGIIHRRELELPQATTTGDSSMAKKPSKSQQARDHKAKNPNATTQEIADALKISYNAVYQALNKAVGTKKPRRGRKAKAPIAAHAALDHAFDFVTKVGGLVHAEQLIDKLKAIKAKL